VSCNATLIDLEGCVPLWAAEPCHHETGPRGLQIAVAQFGDGDGVPAGSLLALRIAALGSRTDDVLSSLASELHRIGTVEANFDSPRSAPDANLTDENALAGRVDPNPKSGGAAAPQEVIGLLRLGGIDKALGQGWHQESLQRITGSIPEAADGNCILSRVISRHRPSQKKLCFQQ
jgi:hypothetical protein